MGFHRVNPWGSARGGANTSITRAYITGEAHRLLRAEACNSNACQSLVSDVMLNGSPCHHHAVHSVKQLIRCNGCWLLGSVRHLRKQKRCVTGLPHIIRRRPHLPQYDFKARIIAINCAGALGGDTAGARALRP